MTRLTSYACLLTFILICFLGGCAATKPKGALDPAVKPVRAELPREVMAENISFDAETGEIRYILPEPAYVRIRVGIKESGFFLAHAADWEYRDKGEHTQVWDGKAEGDDQDYRGRRDLMAVLTAMPAQNSAGAQGTGRLRKAPGITMSFPESERVDNQGRPIVKGRAPVRITIGEEDAKWLLNTRYELVLYIDQLFLMEEEEGLNPFTYYVDTSRLRDGRHSITAVIACYTGEASSLTQSVIVENH